MLSHADAVAKTGCENVETTNPIPRRFLFAGFVARVGNERLTQTSDVWGFGEGKGFFLGGGQ